MQYTEIVHQSKQTYQYLACHQVDTQWYHCYQVQSLSQSTEAPRNTLHTHNMANVQIHAYVHNLPPLLSDHVRCRRLQLSQSVRSISGFHQVCNWRQLNVEAFTADVDRSELIVCFRPATCSLRASVTTRRCGHRWTITCHCSWSVSDVIHLLLAMTVSVEMCATFARF